MAIRKSANSQFPAPWCQLGGREPGARYSGRVGVGGWRIDDGEPAPLALILQARELPPNEPSWGFQYSN